MRNCSSCIIWSVFHQPLCRMCVLQIMSNLWSRQILSKPWWGAQTCLEPRISTGEYTEALQMTGSHWENKGAFCRLESWLITHIIISYFELWDTALKRLSVRAPGPSQRKSTVRPTCPHIFIRDQKTENFLLIRWNLSLFQSQDRESFAPVIQVEKDKHELASRVKEHI